MKEREKRPKKIELLRIIRRFDWVQSLGDPKRSIYVVRFMGTIIELMYIYLCAVYLGQ
jgi:hypothetical protein